MNNDSLHSEDHLTAKQMQDYLSGKLTDAEMHTIEKHLLECEFCAEAMEGLESMEDTTTFEQDVSKLKIAIGKRTLVTTKERKPLVLYKKVLRIAAMLAVLIVASVLVTNYFKSNVEQKEFSEKKKTEIPKKKKAEEKGKEKQAKLSSDSTLKPTVEKSPKGAQESTKPETVKEKPEIEEPEIEENINLVDNDKQAKSIESVSEEEAIVMDEAIVLDEEIVSAETMVVEEDLASVESMEVEEAMVMGMEADNEAMPTSTRERSMYTAAGAEAKSAQKKNVSKTEIIQPQPLDNNAFQQYLKDSLRYPEEAIKANIKGFVMLQFMVGPNGEISQIKVIESPGYGCDEEAIRLLREGPQWIPGSKDGIPTKMEAELKVKFKPL